MALTKVTKHIVFGSVLIAHYEKILVTKMYQVVLLSNGVLTLQ